MKITTGFHATPLHAALLVGALLGTSCVSKARHDEAQAEIKFYQRAYQDLESYQGKLEAENERLRGELELYQGTAPIEAGLSPDIDERLAELRGIVANLGTGSEDVTVLSVEGGYGLRLPDAILFDSGSEVLSADGRALLVKMAGEIAARPYARIWVRGHTDSDPVVKPATKERFPHGNIQLSTARAIEVAVALGSQGAIAKDKIVVAGFGPNEPVAPNDSAAGKLRNRRVEIFVIEDPDAPGGQ